jgi:hypothetical protein
MTVMTPETVAAIKEQLTAEVIKEAAKITEDVAKGTLSDESLAVRHQAAMNLRSRVEYYSGILGDALDTLKTVLTVAEQAAAGTQAVIQSDAFAGVF